MDDIKTLPSEFETILADPQQRQPFRLLDLPTELWLHILACSVRRPCAIDPTWKRVKHQQSRIVAQPPITRVCRQLRQEALPLFYHLNRFELHHLHRTACTRDWLVAIGDANRRAMGSLTLHTDLGQEAWVGLFRTCGIVVEVEDIKDGCDESLVASSKVKTKMERWKSSLVVRFS